MRCRLDVWCGIPTRGAGSTFAGLIRSRLTLAGLTLIGLAVAGLPARATPALTMDVATGEVLYQQQATQPWFPASTTKLMTVYVALQAVREGKIALDTPLLYSNYARSQPPSKMGFRPGTQVTLQNALRMLMVRSANDIAVTVAEGVSGSVEAFADDMNRAAAELGLRESHIVNPKGLPNPQHVSSARDMALIARALYTSFPEQLGLFNIGALSLGPEIITNHNNLLGRYPGADGMKTGFTCSAGFNVVASAFRDGRRVVAIVMGAPSVAARTAKVAALFDRAFAGIDRPSASIVALSADNGQASQAAPDMRNEVCRARGRLIAQFNAEVEQLDAPLLPPPSGLGLSALSPERSFLFTPPAVIASAPTAMHINTMPPVAFTPVPVHIGAEPGYQGPVAQARVPHSAIGSEPMPATAEAYAPTESGSPIQGIGIAPLAVDPNALPLRGRRVRAAHRGRPGRAAALKAAAEAPDTKVLAGAEDNGEPAAKPGRNDKAKHGAAAGRAAHAVRPVDKPAPKAGEKPGAKLVGKAGGRPVIKAKESTKETARKAEAADDGR